MSGKAYVESLAFSTQEDWGSSIVLILMMLLVPLSSGSVVTSPSLYPDSNSMFGNALGYQVLPVHFNPLPCDGKSPGSEYNVHITITTVYIWTMDIQ